MFSTEMAWGTDSSPCPGSQKIASRITTCFPISIDHTLSLGWFSADAHRLFRVNGNASLENTNQFVISCCKCAMRLPNGKETADSLDERHT
jgi:hypothetical protein